MIHLRRILLCGLAVSVALQYSVSHLKGRRHIQAQSLERRIALALALGLLVLNHIAEVRRLPGDLDRHL